MKDVLYILSSILISSILCADRIMSNAFGSWYFYHSEERFSLSLQSVMIVVPWVHSNYATGHVFYCANASQLLYHTLSLKDSTRRQYIAFFYMRCYLDRTSKPSIRMILSELLIVYDIAERFNPHEYGNVLLLFLNRDFRSNSIAIITFHNVHRVVTKRMVHILTIHWFMATTILFTVGTFFICSAFTSLFLFALSMLLNSPLEHWG